MREARLRRGSEGWEGWTAGQDGLADGGPEAVGGAGATLGGPFVFPVLTGGSST